MKDGQIAIKRKGSLRFLDADEIIYIEAIGHHALIHTEKEDIDVYSSLKRLEERLFQHGMIRIHRSFMVSVEYIRAIEDGEVMLGDSKKTTLPIGAGYDDNLAKEVKKRHYLFI